MNDRQIEIVEAIRTDVEKLYWLTGGTHRLQVASINLGQEPILSHDELQECLTRLTKETYNHKQRKLMELVSSNTLNILDDGLDLLGQEAIKAGLDVPRAELIECYQYLVWRANDVLDGASKCLEMLEEELEFMAVCEVCGGRQEQAPVHICEYCEHTNGTRRNT